jgi:hypothetical protein
MGKWRYSSTILKIRTRMKWSASRPNLFNPTERTPGTDWIEDWVRVRAGLNAVKKRKMLPLPGIEPRPSSPSLYRLSYPSSNYVW